MLNQTTYIYSDLLLLHDKFYRRTDLKNKDKDLRQFVNKENDRITPRMGVPIDELKNSPTY